MSDRRSPRQGGSDRDGSNRDKVGSGADRVSTSNAGASALSDALLALLLSALALPIRLHNLHRIPRYTDETGEVSTALAIAFEGARPLIHNDAYRGAFWAWLMAAPLAIFGPTPGLPRLMTALLGALAVGATYLLGREVAGRHAGILAALFMTTAFAPVALFSHVAWSNHSTPLWVTLALWLTLKGAWSTSVDSSPDLGPSSDSAPVPMSETRGAGDGIGGGRSASDTGRTLIDRSQLRNLALAGLLWGLALQTHPSVIAPLLGTVLWYLSKPARRARLRSAGPWIALSLFVLAQSPVLIHNIGSMMDDGSIAFFDEATDESQPVNRDFGMASLRNNVLGMVGQMGRAAGAGRPFEPGESETSMLLALDAAILNPVVTLVYALLLLSALVWAALSHRDANRRSTSKRSINAEGLESTPPPASSDGYPDPTEGLRMIAWAAWASFLILPLLNESWLNYLDMRYLGFLLPMAYVAVGAAVMNIWNALLIGRRGKLRKRWQRSQMTRSADVPTEPKLASSSEPEGRGIRPYLALAILLLMLYPLVAQKIYYDREEAAGRTNDPLLETIDTLAAGIATLDGMAIDSESPPQQTFIDKGMRPIKMEGGGDPTRSFEQLLRLQEIEYGISDTDELRWFMDNDQTTTYWLILAEPSAEQLLAEGYPLSTEQVGSVESEMFKLEKKNRGSGDAEARPTDWRLMLRPGAGIKVETNDDE